MLEWNFEDAQHWCRSVDRGPENTPYYGMGWERYTILICHHLKVPLSEAWPHFKVWD